MKAIERIVALLAKSESHSQYAESLSVGSPVAVAKLSINIEQDITVSAITSEGLELSDGRTYSFTGTCGDGYCKARFIVEPIELSREQQAHKHLVSELADFPWKALTTEQLDGALKYARSKYMTSPKMKTKEKLEQKQAA